MPQAVRPPNLTPEQSASHRRKKAWSRQQKRTPAETLLWRHLDKHQLDGYRFRSQAVLYGYIADFYCQLSEVVVEVDGGYHQEPEQTAKDKLREGHLAKRGILTLRFTNEEVMGDLPYVLLAISKACHERGPEPWTPEERAARWGRKAPTTRPATQTVSTAR